METFDITATLAGSGIGQPAAGNSGLFAPSQINTPDAFETLVFDGSASFDTSGEFGSGSAFEEGASEADTALVSNDATLFAALLPISQQTSARSAPSTGLDAAVPAEAASPPSILPDAPTPDTDGNLSVLERREFELFRSLDGLFQSPLPTGNSFGSTGSLFANPPDLNDPTELSSSPPLNDRTQRAQTAATIGSEGGLAGFAGLDAARTHPLPADGLRFIPTSGATGDPSFSGSEVNTNAQIDREFLRAQLENQPTLQNNRGIGVSAFTGQVNLSETALTTPQIAGQHPALFKTGESQNVAQNPALSLSALNETPNAARPPQSLASLLNTAFENGPDGAPPAPAQANIPVVTGENQAFASQLPVPSQTQPLQNAVSSQAQAAAQYSGAAFQEDSLPALAAQISRQVAAGREEFRIQLNPLELGRVDVRLANLEDGTVQARIVVERSETLDLFQRDSRALERALTQSGLKLGGEGIDLSLNDGSSGNASNPNAFSESGDRESGGQNHPPNTAPEEAALTAEAAVVPHPESFHEEGPSQILTRQVVNVYAQIKPGQLNIQV